MLSRRETTFAASDEVERSVDLTKETADKTKMPALNWNERLVFPCEWPFVALNDDEFFTLSAYAEVGFVQVMFAISLSKLVRATRPF